MPSISLHATTTICKLENISSCFLLQYIDAVRFGNLALFQRIEAACGDWWFPTLDRGAGAALHIAADHGQLAAARFLIAQRGVPVNQLDLTHGWTPLMRCAHVVHYKHAPFFQVGTSPHISFEHRDRTCRREISQSCYVLRPEVLCCTVAALSSPRNLPLHPTAPRIPPCRSCLSICCSKGQTQMLGPAAPLTS